MTALITAGIYDIIKQEAAVILLSATIGLLPSVITGRIVDETLLGKDMALLIRLLLPAFVTLAASQMKLFTREEREYERFRTVNKEVSRLSMKEQRSGKWFHAVSQDTYLFNGTIRENLHDFYLWR